MENRIKESLRQVRQAFTKSKTPVTDQMKEQYRMRYYNVKALQLLYANELYSWDNCSREEALLAQLQTYGIQPSLAKWREEWQTFVQECIDYKNKREQEREDNRLWLKKWQHLVKLKYMKMSSLIGRLKLHRGVSVFVYSSFNFSYKQKPRILGRYLIHICIDHAEQTLQLKYDQVDKRLDQVISIIKQINSMVPLLRKQIAIDSKNHGDPLYLGGDYYHSIYKIKNSLYLYDTSEFGKPITDTTAFTSSETIAAINHLIEEFTQENL